MRRHQPGADQQGWAEAHGVEEEAHRRLVGLFLTARIAALAFEASAIRGDYFFARVSARPLMILAICPRSR